MADYKYLFEEARDLQLKLIEDTCFSPEESIMEKFVEELYLMISEEVDVLVNGSLQGDDLKKQCVLVGALSTAILHQENLLNAKPAQNFMERELDEIKKRLDEISDKLRTAPKDPVEEMMKLKDKVEAIRKYTAEELYFLGSLETAEMLALPSIHKKDPQELISNSRWKDNEGNVYQTILRSEYGVVLIRLPKEKEDE